MEDRYDSLYTGQQIEDAIDRAKAGGEIDALITAMKGAGWTTETLKGLADLISTKLDKTASPNSNLLHNWDFRNPVNQRGQSSYTVAGQYTIDRWKVANASLALTSGEVSDVTLSANGHNFFQYIEDFSKYAGLTLTATLRYKNQSGNGLVLMLDSTGSGAGGDHVEVPLTATSGEVSVTFSVSSSPARLVYQIRNLGTETVSLTPIAAKLELGSISTLANDPPADFGEQLAKCQRYYQVGGVGFTGKWQTANNCFLTGIFPVQMRVNPTVTLLTTSPVAVSVAGAEFTGAGSTVTGVTRQNGLLWANIGGFTGATPGAMCQMFGNYLAFSADL